jgi:hypothetical protein
MERVSSEVVTVGVDMQCVIKYGVLVLEREWVSTQCAVRVCMIKYGVLLLEREWVSTQCAVRVWRVPHLFAKVRKDDVVRWPVALFHGRCVQTVVLFGQHRREGLE